MRFSLAVWGWVGRQGPLLDLMDRLMKEEVSTWKENPQEIPGGDGQKEPHGEVTATHPNEEHETPKV